MIERRLVIALIPLFFLLAFARGNLQTISERDYVAVSFGASISTIASAGGTLDPDSTPDPASNSTFTASYASQLRTPFDTEIASGSREAGQPSAKEEDEHHHHESGHDHENEPGHDTEKGLGHDHNKEADQSNTTVLSSGMIMILHQLGLAELAANLLWIQMDQDSHAENWHRVHFFLELIPKIDPHFVEAYLLRAAVLDRAFQEHDEAIAIIETGIKNNPMREDLLVQLGVYTLNFGGKHGEKRDLVKALSSFGKILQMPGHQAFIERFFAFTLAAMGRRDEAVSFLTGLQSSKDRPDRQKAFDLQAISRISSGEEF
ncbi:MAG: hypothetical protein WA705_11020 [Candidatus Ozemobacteraceae bacterium]